MLAIVFGVARASLIGGFVRLLDLFGDGIGRFGVDRARSLVEGFGFGLMRFVRQREIFAVLVQRIIGHCTTGG